MMRTTCSIPAVRLQRCHISPLGTVCRRSKTNARPNASGTDDVTTTARAGDISSHDCSSLTSRKQRIRDFPSNTKQLLQDIFRVWDIYDASQTPRNAWTNRPQVGVRMEHKIPRRQHEQIRQVMEDIKIVTPLVVLWIPPIIGLLPLVLGIEFPRQSLSRQYLNDYEKKTFAVMELKQRYEYYPIVSDLVWTLLHVTHYKINLPPSLRTTNCSTILGEDDAAGPIWDNLEPLFLEFCHMGLIQHYEANTATATSSTAYRRPHLIALALALGYGQRFPAPLPEWVVHNLIPSFWLARYIRGMAQQIWRDDMLLLDEGYHIARCDGMTDMEIMEACRIRGLPVKDTYEVMRECMTNHLIMLDCLLRKTVAADIPKQHLPIFALYLPILRQDYCRAKDIHNLPF